MAEIYDYVYGKITKLSNNEKKIFIINKIEEMNRNMNIVSNLKDTIKFDDIDELVNHAYKESHPLYPVPKFLNKEILKNIYIKLMH